MTTEAVKPVAKRRSVVELEKWLDEEIALAKRHLAELVVDAEEIADKQAERQCRLDVLLTVKAKFAPEAFDTLPLAEDE